MARINPLFGRMKGKYGGSVMYSYNGKQCMRERVIEVRNPRSSRQAIQRAILATCGRFVSAFSPILNNSIQSESSKVKTLAKIRSYNMDYLRQLAAQNLGFYNRKGSVYVSPNDYVISRGDLQGINPLRSEAARLLLDSGSLAVPSSELRPFESYTASQAFPSVAVGDQITILATYTSDFSRETTIVRYCRFAFKDDTTPVFVFDAGGPTRLNPAAIDLSKADGDWQLLAFSDDTIGDVSVATIDVDDFVGTDRVDMAGIIISREADKKRSSASMVAAIFDDDQDFLLDGVYPTYMDGGSPIDMPSDVYLNNDATVVEPPFLTLLNLDDTDVILPMTKAISTTEAGMFKFSGSPATRFNLYIDFSIAGTSYSAQIDQASSATVGAVTWRYASGYTITAEGTASGSVTITKVRYRDNEGHDITWQ